MDRTTGLSPINLYHRGYELFNTETVLLSFLHIVCLSSYLSPHFAVPHKSLLLLLLPAIPICDILQHLGLIKYNCHPYYSLVHSLGPSQLHVTQLFTKQLQVPQRIYKRHSCVYITPSRWVESLTKETIVLPLPLTPPPHYLNCSWPHSPNHTLIQVRQSLITFYLLKNYTAVTGSDVPLNRTCRFFFPPTRILFTGSGCGTLERFVDSDGAEVINYFYIGIPIRSAHHHHRFFAI